MVHSIALNCLELNIPHFQQKAPGSVTPSDRSHKTQSPGRHLCPLQSSVGGGATGRQCLQLHLKISTCKGDFWWHYSGCEIIFETWISNGDLLIRKWPSHLLLGGALFPAKGLNGTLFPACFPPVPLPSLILSSWESRQLMGSTEW